MTNLKQQALVLAECTQDAYSYDNYGKRSWIACAEMLLRMGFTKHEVEEILRSKWTRWAADMATDRKSWRYGHTTSSDLRRFLDTMTLKQIKAEISTW